METKHVPMRMCMGCHEMKPKKGLIRIVKSKSAIDAEDSNIFIDKNGKSLGRGAYICKKDECLKKVQKTRKLERTFSCRISKELYEKLGEEVSNNEQ